MKPYHGVPFSPSRVVRVACESMGIPHAEVIASGRYGEGSRSQSVVLARRLCIAACQRFSPGASWPEIARAMGRRSHTSSRDQSNRLGTIPPGVIDAVLHDIEWRLTIKEPVG